MALAESSGIGCWGVTMTSWPDETKTHIHVPVMIVDVHIDYLIWDGTQKAGVVLVDDWIRGRTACGLWMAVDTRPS